MPTMREALDSLPPASGSGVAARCEDLSYAEMAQVLTADWQRS